MTPTSLLVSQLIDLVADERLAELTISDAGRTVRVVRGHASDGVPHSSNEAHAEVPAPSAALVERAALTVTAPMTGTFYRSSSEGGEPLVSEGSIVGSGTPLGLIEAMKMLNDVLSTHAGIVQSVLCENGQAVEQGQPLFMIESRQD